MKLFWLSLLLIIFVSSIGIANAEIDAVTDSTIYIKGDEVKLYGFIPELLYYPNGYDVIMRVYEPQFGNLVDIRQVTPTDAMFSTVFKSESPLWKYDGVYRIIINHGEDRTALEFFLKSVE